MTPTTDDTQTVEVSQEEFRSMLYERMRLAIQVTLTSILDEEVEAFVNAERYQRTSERRDYRNGSYTRDLGTNVGQIEDLEIPRTRKGFKTQLFERYQRRQAELDDAICAMFVKGASTAQVGEVIEALVGVKPSSSTVSRVFHTLDEEFSTWKTRKLQGHYVYVFADGTYFSVIYDDEGCKMPILAVTGIDSEGRREVLSFRIGDRENQSAWEDVMEDLKSRGVEQIDLWISDGNQAMLNAIQAKFSTSKRQRCIKHKMENVLGYIPKKQVDLVEPELKAIFYQDNLEKAEQVWAAFCEKYQSIYPTAIDCLNRDKSACLTFYAFPQAHQRFIRTTNIIERLFQEVKKRSHKMSAAFRNEDSCMLMFYAIIRSLKLRRIPKIYPDPTPELLHNS